MNHFVTSLLSYGKLKPLFHHRILRKQLGIDISASVKVEEMAWSSRYEKTRADR